MQDPQPYQSALHKHLTQLLSSQPPTPQYPQKPLTPLQLLTFKTEPCPHPTNPLHSPAHHILEYPYYYSCEYYHTQRDRRRVPVQRGEDGLERELYRGVYVGDGFEEGFCCNWVEFVYHPQVYKRRDCGNVGCRRRYCPRVHAGEVPRERARMAHKEVENRSLLESVKAFQGIRNAPSLASLSLSPAINHEIVEAEQHLQTLSQRIHKLDQQQATKQSTIKNQIKTLAAVTAPTHSNLLLNPPSTSPSPSYSTSQSTPSPSSTYDRLYYNEQLTLIEDRHHEFKMFKDKDPRRISGIVLEYISAFLNSDGGSIYLGINDQSVVHGIEVDGKWIDKFQLAIDADGRDHLNPPLIPQKYSLKIIPVIHKWKSDLKVIQIQVYPRPQSQKKILTLYKKQCYLRMNASNHRLSASDIMQYMRLINNKNQPTQPLVLPLPNEEKIQQMGYKELKDYQQYLARVNGKINTILRKKEREDGEARGSDPEI